MDLTQDNCIYCENSHLEHLPMTLGTNLAPAACCVPCCTHGEATTVATATTTSKVTST
jgi:hypothetical protein